MEAGAAGRRGGGSVKTRPFPKAANAVTSVAWLPFTLLSRTEFFVRAHQSTCRSNARSNSNRASLSPRLPLAPCRRFMKSWPSVIALGSTTWLRGTTSTSQPANDRGVSRHRRSARALGRERPMARCRRARLRAIEHAQRDADHDVLRPARVRQCRGAAPVASRGGPPPRAACGGQSDRRADRRRVRHRMASLRARRSGRGRDCRSRLLCRNAAARSTRVVHQRLPLSRCGIFDSVLNPRSFRDGRFFRVHT